MSFNPRQVDGMRDSSSVRRRLLPHALETLNLMERQVLGLHAAGLSLRAIGRAILRHHSTVQWVFKRAKRKAKAGVSR